MPKALICLLFLAFLLPKTVAQVGPPPVITVQPSDVTVLNHDSATLSVTVSSGTSLTYKWYLNGKAVGGGDQSSLIIDKVDDKHDGTYYVKVSNASGSVNSSNAVVTIGKEIDIKDDPNDVTVVQGQTATFTVDAEGTSPKYQWTFNGTNLLNATNVTLTLTNVQGSQAGNYAVVVTNFAGSQASQSATLTVHVPAGIVSQPQSQSVVQNQNATFTVVAAGDATLRYQWKFGGTNLTGSTAATLTITNVQASRTGNYTVVVTNFYGSVTSAVAVLTISLAPGITTQPQSVTVPQGQNTNLSVVASGTAPFHYQWTFGGTNLNGSTNQTLSFTNVQAARSGNYAVVVTNSFGSVTSSVAVLTVQPVLSFTIQPRNQFAKQGSNVTFTVVSPDTGISYQWYFNNAAIAGGQSSTLSRSSIGTNNAGNYFVVISKAGSISATSTVASLSVLSAPSQNQSVAAGQNVSFTVMATGAAPFAYQWKFNGTNLLNATNNFLTLNNVQTNQSGTYSIIVTNFAGSVTSSVGTLTVNIPAFITTQPVSVSLATGLNLSLSVGAGGTGPLSYQWYFKNNPIPFLLGGQNSTLLLLGLNVSYVGDYRVVVSNNWGSVTSVVASVTLTNLNIALASTGGMTATGFCFQLSVPVNHTYVIEASTNMSNWWPISTNVATSSSVSCTDARATNYPSCYYRAIVY